MSHSSKDRRSATALAEILRAHGLKVWYSATNIAGAQQWHDEIGLALDLCDWFVLLLSPSALKSMWVKRELVFALQERRYENKIIPVIISPCDANKLSWTLGALQFIDLTDTKKPDRYAPLLRVWNLEFDPQWRRKK